MSIINEKLVLEIIKSLPLLTKIQKERCKYGR